MTLAHVIEIIETIFKLADDGRRGDAVKEQARLKDEVLTAISNGHLTGPHARLASQLALIVMDIADGVI